MKRLVEIQQGLKSPKNKNGDGGRYKFRSAEDIFEKAKPWLDKTKTAVVTTDELVEVGGRVAIKATASLIGDTGIIASASGWACLDSHIVTGKGKDGETYDKKTMSNEQCTGSASSYARKYALCGLFAIDNDENDPDQPNIKPAPENPKAQPKPAQVPAAPKVQPQPVQVAQPTPQAPAPEKKKINLDEITEAVGMNKVQRMLDDALKEKKCSKEVYDMKMVQLVEHGRKIGCTFTDSDGWISNDDLFGEEDALRY